jgi:uncharacterized membrane protein YqjE
MEETTGGFRQLAGNAKSLARRLLTIGENRLELLAVEVQEERERLLQAFLLAIGVGAFGMLAGIALTASVVVMLWDYSHLATLLVLTAIYAITAFVLYNRLTAMLRDWQTLPDSLNQLRKDRACVEKILT